jgi:hypothetical protein
MSHPKRRNKIDGQFNARTLKMMESPAYRALSLSAHRVMDRICIELMHHGGNDNGKLPVTYEQFVEYGIARHAIAPAIRARGARVCRGDAAGHAERRRISIAGPVPPDLRLLQEHTPPDPRLEAH